MASPDVSAEAAKLIGIDNAIIFHADVESLSSHSAIPPNLSECDAVRLALAHDPRVQVALAKVRVAEADAKQARLLPNPILNVDARFRTHPGDNTAFETTLSGDLIGLLQKPGQIGAADKRLREAASDALTTVLDLIAEVQSACVNASATDEQIQNAHRRQELLGQLREIAAKRLKAGEIGRLDVLTLDAQLAQGELDLADLEVQRADARLLLARLIGQPRANPDFSLAPRPEPVAEPLAPESDWIDAALAHRPEIASKIWELKALGDDYAVASFSPITGSSLGVHAEHDPNWRVGPALDIPLPFFDFGQASRAKVTAQQIAARHDLLQKQRESIEETRLAYSSCSHARRSLDNARQKLLPLQQQQLDQARHLYQVGETDLGTLLLAQSDYTTALSKIIDLQQKAALARIKLDRAVGGAAIAPR
ncbi:MAG: TolC family protein [Phycisphaerales bacterium]|nr:TolC family protein [Phycisphaerales bacterium]